ncbi:YdcF family protein [Candidatus Peregrinibacteria bacterium]|nr:YdcF family protein [Candidatus Peregrinibacteria bacterium]
MIPTFRHWLALLHFILCCFAISVLLFAALCFYVMRGFEGDAVLPAECALVFGAAVHGKEDPGPGIARRVDTAVNLYRVGKIQTVILTGGKGNETQESEATVMRRAAVLWGIDPVDVRTEERATSTVENLLFSKALTEDCDSVVGISDRYHLARIRFLANNLGWPELRTYPADRIANASFETQSIIREAAALLYTAMTGAATSGNPRP